MNLTTEHERIWRGVLVDGHEPLRRMQRIFRRLPSDPRCKLCFNPFGGAGGRLLRITGFRPSRKNPNLCTTCCDRLPPGGIEIDIAVLFADVRGSTALGERVGAGAFAAGLQDFYATATTVLLRHGALIDKLIGDGVMAIFVPGIAGADYREQATRAAPELVRAMRREAGISVGVAVNAGTAFVGNVGFEHVVDLTALGDCVNTASRLQGHAGAGEVVFGEQLHLAPSLLTPALRAERIAIRGREAPIEARVLTA